MTDPQLAATATTAMPFTTANLPTRPDPALRTLYLLRALLAGPGVVFLLPYLLFRYQSLRYRFDDDGVSMKWGVLFRREIDLAYDRIQDIHLSAGFVERWLGIASIAVQTASGNASAELTLEGLRDAEAVRDLLYARMRGHHAAASSSAASLGPHTAAGASEPAAAGDAAEAARLLRQIADDLRAVREALAQRSEP